MEDVHLREGKYDPGVGNESIFFDTRELVLKIALHVG